MDALPAYTNFENDLGLPRSTELFSIVDQFNNSSSSEHVVVCGEETGGTDALMPVMRELLDRNIGITALLAGNGRHMLMTRGEEHGLRTVSLEAWPEAANDPDAVVITPSEDGRLEEYLLEKYAGTVFTVIEDYHESSRRAVGYAARLAMEIPTVCVVDHEAKRLLKRRFSNLSMPIVITGSPTFDKLLDEDVSAMRKHMKTELGIAQNHKFVAFLLPRLGEKSLLLANDFADAIRDTNQHTVFTARRHPSDSIPRSAYDKIFEGLNILDTSAIPTDKVAEATDLIIAQRSVTILRAVTRQQPTITLTQFAPEGFTLPLVDSGASLPAQPGELSLAIKELLEANGNRYADLKVKMKPYSTDGKAASRVADVVCRKLDPIHQRTV